MGVFGKFHGPNNTGKLHSCAARLYSCRMSEFTLEAADRLRRAVGDMVRTTQQKENRPDGQLETLGFLIREGPQSIAQLARRRRIRHQSMSSTVVELEAHGLVVRSPDPADGRGVIIMLTDDGAAMVQKSRDDRSSALLRAAQAVLTQEELATLAQTAGIFDKLRFALTEE